MDIVGTFVDFALLGAEWVLWLLVGLSVISIGIMIDRALWFRGRDGDTPEFVRGLRVAWRTGEEELEAFLERWNRSTAIPIRVALAGIAERAHGPDAVAEAMNGERARWRKEADKNLIILGTLGNNTPFVGLFGTVLGIIGALDQLQRDTGAGDTQVMGELSKALVATAIGLLVAIPAVVAYNYFNRRLKVLMTGADECAHAVLGLVHYGERTAARTIEAD
jgi:biopolymer transport protein ExbB/TolQ